MAVYMRLFRPFGRSQHDTIFLRISLTDDFLIYSPTSLSARSKSSPRPRSRTDLSHNGSVWELVTPSGTISPRSLEVYKVPKVRAHEKWRRDKIYNETRARQWGNLDWHNATDTTLRGDIGVRPASVSRCLAQSQVPPAQKHPSDHTNLFFGYLFSRFSNDAIFSIFRTDGMSRIAGLVGWWGGLMVGWRFTDLMHTVRYRVGFDLQGVHMGQEIAQWKKIVACNELWIHVANQWCEECSALKAVNHLQNNKSNMRTKNPSRTDSLHSDG